MSDHSDSFSEEQSLSSSTPSSGLGDGNEKEEVSAPVLLAKRESRKVLASKLLVFTVLVAAAAAVGLATHIIVSTEENDDFETQFTDFAVEVVDISQHNAETIYGTIEGLSEDVTSAALHGNQPFPFVTVPHWGIRGVHAAEHAGALALGYAPIVQAHEKEKWENYTLEDQEWLSSQNGDPIQHPSIYHSEDGTYLPELGDGPFAPLWQLAPIPRTSELVNFNLFSIEAFSRLFNLISGVGRAEQSEVLDLSFLADDRNRDAFLDHPTSVLFQPVFDKFSGNDRSVRGFLFAVLSWETYFSYLLPEGVKGVFCVLRDTCHQEFTFVINGATAEYLGEGDLHDPRYDDLELLSEFAPFAVEADGENATGHCEYSISVYPSKEMHDDYLSNKPAVFTAAVVLVFFFTSMVFVVYDCFVQRRQNRVLESAVRTDRIVSSLFPKSVQDRLFSEANSTPNKNTGIADTAQSTESKRSFTPAGKFRLKSYLGDSSEELDTESSGFVSKPIADLFPETTVMFADIAGFTAWSSQREPSQVFILLETLYGAFDKVAKRRGVFKVETIGDCYVAVTGLPEPREDHATAMAKFARDCITKMSQITKKLEITLGPETGDLALRIGLHSGPVTAGVLRGEKSRFQLFGDTVNTAARMESTGQINRIHVSKATAESLKKDGRAMWLRVREDTVLAKGKGEMDTFWVDFRAESNASGESGSMDTDDTSETEVTSLDLSASPRPWARSSKAVSSKTKRLVEWNTDVLYRILLQVVAARDATGQPKSASKEPQLNRPEGQTVLEEVNYCIEMPEFDPERASGCLETESVELDPQVKKQLRDYLMAVACSYRDNAFHNFEHASHVAMSVVKLLSRVVAPDAVNYANETGQVASDLHNYTFGITSDPMIQFAAVFSSLIHDADHRGVPNVTLLEEDPELAARYKQKSVAEQNSVDVAWEILMQPSFKELRAAIYTNETELKRFRQLLVVSVMATDIADKDLQGLRRSRWETAFSDEAREAGEDANLKATIVLEHLIQASDIAHTMQHWHIYQKWNGKLFEEMYNAYNSGRVKHNPAVGWYKGEIGFFDFYIIPLAKKLKNCGVFGVSSDEYLNYATSNRQEWALKGEEIVQKLVEKHTPIETIPETIEQS